jgi:hypothetical protein
MISEINSLKRKIFFEMLNLAGRAFILVEHSQDVVIGKRGFLPAEKEKGLILVFNSRMNFEWDDSGISANLVFGSAPEKCFIPHDSIISVFSPELSAQFSVSPTGPQKPEAEPEKTLTGKESPDNKVVKIDFNKKR